MYYKENIRSFSDRVERLRRISRGCACARLAVFVLMAWLVYCHFSGSVPAALWLAAACLAVYVAVCVADHRLRMRIDRLGRMIKVCGDELSCLDGDFSPFADGAGYMDTEHEYSYDLDIFGRESLFNRLCRTVTQSGADRLAYMLAHPADDRKTIEERRDAIAELRDMADWRIRFLSNIHISGTGIGGCREVPCGAFVNAVVNSPLPWITRSLAALSLVSCIFGVLPWGCFFMVFTVQLFLGGCLSGTMKKTVTGVERMHRECTQYLSVLGDIRGAGFRSALLVRTGADLFGGEHDSGEAFRRLEKILKMFDWRNNVVVYILLNGTMLFDAMLLKRFALWNAMYAGHLGQWIGCVAGVDALVSLATYAYNNPSNTPAEILPPDSDVLLDADGVYHPFLSPDKAVANSFVLKKNSVAIVTGANMAGKSTFLRTLGVTYVLACCGVPVCARSFRFSIVSLFSGMRTADNLAGGISYFKAEILRLRRLVRHVKSHPFTFVILDEILRGTNSQDKLSGSAFFLREIVRYPVSAVIATHDIGLADLEAEAPGVYRNYCFEIERGADIRYTYKLHDGVVRNLNASYLLSRMMHEECGTPLDDGRER